MYQCIHIAILVIERLAITSFCLIISVLGELQGFELQAFFPELIWYINSGPVVCMRIYSLVLLCELINRRYSRDI